METAVEFRRVNAYLAESLCGWYVIVKPSAKKPGPYTAFCGRLWLGEFGKFGDAQAKCEQHEGAR